MKKKFFIDYLFLTIGTFVLAFGINVFSAPNKLSAGGINSIATVLLYLFDIRLSVTNIVCNMILFVWGYKNLGRYSVIKTASGILLLSLFLEITNIFPTYTDDIIIASAVGGVFMGIGIGFVIRRGASTGGSDFAALIIHRFIPHVSVAYLIMIIDCSIVLIAGIVFKSAPVTFYSILSLLISSRITDAIITFGDNAKNVQIFSDSATTIANNIMTTLKRGVTGIYCRGMYSSKEQLMLFCVVDNKSLPSLINIIRCTDKNAFVVISSSKEVLGNGFKE